MALKAKPMTLATLTTTCALALVALLAWGGGSPDAEAQPARGVAFHLDSDEHMNRAFRQITRQLEAMPNNPIEVIMVASAVNALLEGAKDDNGGLYSAQFEQLLAEGVIIYACETTLLSFNKTVDDVAFGVSTVPSGIVKLSQLQIHHNYAYQKL